MSFFSYKTFKITLCDVFKLVFIKPNCIDEKITDLWSSSSSIVPVNKKAKMGEEITAEVTEETINQSNAVGCHS